MDPCWCLPFLISLMFSLSASQSTSTSCITCNSHPACGGCNVNADILTTSGTSYTYLSTLFETPHVESYLLAYLHFTAYSVTSTTLVKGSCVRQTVSPVPLIDPFIVSVQSFGYNAGLYNVSLGYNRYQYSSARTSAYSVLLDDSYSSLNSRIGYESCTATLPPSPVVPPYADAEIITSTSAPPVSEAALPSATATEGPSVSVRYISTYANGEVQYFTSASPAPAATLALVTAGESPVSARHISTTDIIIVSTIVPTVGLALLVFCFIIIRRYRKKRNQEVSLNQTNMASNTQLYVDRKAELAAEERRRHEVDSQSLRYEMSGEDRVFEIPCGRDSGMVLASLQGTHEMIGLEHSQELEVPGNVS